MGWCHSREACPREDGERESNVVFLNLDSRLSLRLLRRGNDTECVSPNIVLWGVCLVLSWEYEYATGFIRSKSDTFSIQEVRYGDERARESQRIVRICSHVFSNEV